MMMAVSLLPAEVKVWLKHSPSGALQGWVPPAHLTMASSAQQELENCWGKDGAPLKGS